MQKQKFYHISKNWYKLQIWICSQLINICTYDSMFVHISLSLCVHVCVCGCVKEEERHGMKHSVRWDSKKWDEINYISCDFLNQVHISFIPNCKFKFRTLKITSDSVAEFISYFLLFHSKYYCYSYFFTGVVLIRQCVYMPLILLWFTPYIPLDCFLVQIQNFSFKILSILLCSFLQQEGIWNLLE